MWMRRKKRWTKCIMYKIQRGGLYLCTIFTVQPIFQGGAVVHKNSTYSFLTNVLTADLLQPN